MNRSRLLLLLVTLGAWIWSLLVPAALFAQAASQLSPQVLQYVSVNAPVVALIHDYGQAAGW